MKQKFLSALIIILLVLVVIFQCVNIKNIDEGKVQTTEEPTQQVDVTVTPTTTQPAATTTQPTTDAADNESTTVTDSAEKESDKPDSTKEIIDKYTLLVDKFKQQKPAYKKKEYQALPVEYHNFSSIINKALDIAAGYMQAFAA